MGFIKGKIIRFVIVGGSATLVHMGVASAMIFASPNTPIVAANAVAFSVAVLVSFVGHSRYTFQTKGSLFKFFITACVGLACNNVVAYTALWLTDAKLLSVVIGTLAAPIVVYLLSSLWVFSHNKIET